MNDLQLKQVCQNKAELMQTMMGTAAQFSTELIIGPDDHVAGMFNTFLNDATFIIIHVVGTSGSRNS